MTLLSGGKTACAIFLLCIGTTIASSAQVFNTLFDFDATNGASPRSSLAQGRDGNFYGTTDGGGNLSCYVSGGYGYPFGCGTVFRITPQGELATLYIFCAETSGTDCTKGAYPLAGLVLSNDAEFYGTTYGVQDGYCVGNVSATCGTAFKITHEGALTMLHRFCSQPNCPDGTRLESGLVQGTDGSFYGTTALGGARGFGTVFKITSGGSLTTLYDFCSRGSTCSDGGFPQAELARGRDGEFYGTNTEGGDATYCYGGCGTVFKITPWGKLTTLHTFCKHPKCPDGSFPQGLVEATDGNFYGVTIYGGAVGGGTVFKITPSGKFTTLYSFCGCGDGASPSIGLIQGTDGNLYGTTIYGGDATYCGGLVDGCGTIFRITTGGALTRLHSFNGTDGGFPIGALLQATNGVFYGATLIGGNLSCGFDHYGCGAVFSLDMGLGPFVTFVRSYGKVGQTGGILGQGFTGTTSVSLDGTPANFTVVSDTYIRGTVPAGATTGFVAVTTPSGTLTSNKPFRVTPQLLSFDPPSGPVGTQVTIMGVSLTQTQGVGFGNRVPAQFTVNSDTQVTATVPAGAKTGKVGIETKGGIAISAGTFTVAQ